VHGRFKADERDQTIRQFKDKMMDVLVATTVIEVGIDIPNASILIIQHAERFGLSQLHQMRGRVGRGDRRGLTVAVAYQPISDLGRRRLEYFASTTDGFKIAEADLELRGPGEFFGVRQHGLPEFKLANPILDQDVLVLARKWAEQISGEYARNKEKARFLLNHAALFSNIKADLIDVA
jgi:ATP-dependent DNA helicase RecG